MIEYIYFVKCPNCEDEPFDLFDDAKAYALGCLSCKPIITQVEVNRNDFGECVDSCDLGMQWSWEDECQPEVEPVGSMFTKRDLKTYVPDEDPEFANIDNSVNFEPVTSEISALDSVPDNFRRRPIAEDFDRVKAAAKCSRNCYDFYKAIASKAPQKEINKYGKAAYKYVKDQYGLVDDAAEDLLWSGYVVWRQLNWNGKTESLVTRPITEAKTDPFHEAIFEAVDYLTEFSDFFPVPDNIGAVTWEELKDDIRYGLSSDFEIAEIILQYLDKDLAFSRKHIEMFEDDPQSELTLETYDRLKRAYDRAVADYEAKYSEDFEESCTRKPIPEDMSIEDLVEAIEENEDTVECKNCGELYDKKQCCHDTNRKGWVCENCQSTTSTSKLAEKFDPSNEFILYYDDLDFEFVADRDTITDALVDFVTDEEVQRLTNGRFQSATEICDYDTEHYFKTKVYLNDPKSVSEWTKFLDDNCDELFVAHEQEVTDYLKDRAKEAKAEAEYEEYENLNSPINKALNYADYLYHSQKDAEFDFDR